MSQIVTHGELAYLAGQVADDRSANITVQTQQVVNTVDRHEQ